MLYGIDLSTREKDEKRGYVARHFKKNKLSILLYVINKVFSYLLDSNQRRIDITIKETRLEDIYRKDENGVPKGIEFYYNDRLDTSDIKPNVEKDLQEVDLSLVIEPKRKTVGLHFDMPKSGNSDGK